MRYCALATDYDGTLAQAGRVREQTVRALARVRASGRKLVLVTGRVLSDLLAVFPQAALFDRIVAENGAVLHHPASRETRVLCAPPDPAFVAELRTRGVSPLSVGEAIVATWEPCERIVLEVIRTLGLELQVIFNKGAVMVLPSGVNKASGLQAALDELGLSPRNVVGVGDAENDHAFLAACECRVAVADAVPTVRQRADRVTRGGAGQGVEELIAALLATDLAELEPALVRHHVPLGEGEDGVRPALPGYGANVLVAGSSGSGKTTFAAALLERFAERAAQVVVIDPEGDYQELEGLTALGTAARAPSVGEVLELLARPAASAAVNLLGVDLAQRPEQFQALFLRLHELRARVGRPHWIVVDEAHHLVPRDRMPAALPVTEPVQNLVWLTVNPRHVAPAVLATASHVIALGHAPAVALRAVADARGIAAPAVVEDELPPGAALLWRPDQDASVARFRFFAPRVALRRHVRKYAEGELGPDRSFYFRGPDGKLNLRAANLTSFVELADGVDEDTWRHHLESGDYSRWLEESIKDPELAAEVRAIERDARRSEGRARLREAIERRYTRPA